MKRSLLCLVTDRRRLSPFPDPAALDRLVQLVGAAACAGVDYIQIRERDLTTQELTGLVRRSVAAVIGTPAKIVVNDRADVALAAGAHGVHLRSDSIEAVSVRRVLPQHMLIGRSVHGADDAADAARAGGLDYLIFGTLFPSGSKPSGHGMTALTELSNACARVALPMLAIGGLTPERAEQVAKAGAAGVAAIGLFVPPRGIPDDQHLEMVVSRLRRTFDTCQAVP